MNIKLFFSLTHALLAFALLGTAQEAQTSFSVGWFTVDGGGGTSTGGVYSVTATSGQFDAGFLGSGPYTVAGGFWGAGRAGETTNQMVVGFNGLVNSALGQAGLSTVSNKLVVSNIGTNGDDGVAVLLGEAQFGIVTLEDIDAATLPSGTSIRAQAIGVLDGQTNRLMGTLGATVVGGGLHLWADFTPLGGVAAAVVVYDGDQIIAQARNVTGDVARVVGRLRDLSFDPVWAHGPTSAWGIFDFPGRPEITIAGSLPVFGSRIIVIPRFAGGPDPQPSRWIGPLSRIEVRGANFGSFTITREQIGMFHQAHQALGQTTGRGWAGTLDLSNEGNTLEDGVDIRPDDANALDVRWGGVPEIGPPGLPRILRLSAWGLLDTTAPGYAAEALGAVRLTDAGQAFFEITVEPVHTNASSQLVEIFRDGERVTSYRTVGDNAASVLSPPIGASIHAHPFGPGPYCYWLDWPRVIDLYRPDTLKSVKGNQIRITPDFLGGKLLELERLRLNFAGFPNVVLTRERHDREGLLFAGNDHLPVGDAQLTLVPAGTNSDPILTIENIGDTGDDGVIIHAAAASSVGVTLDGFRPAQLPSGAYLKLKAQGEVDSIPDQSMGHIVVEATHGNARIYPDFSALGAATYTISVYDNDRLVATTADEVGGRVPPLGFGGPPPAIIISEEQRLAFRYHNDIKVFSRLRFRLELFLKTPFCPADCPSPWVVIEGLSPVRGNRVVFTPVGSLLGRSGLIKRLSITGRMVDSFHLVDESLGLFGQPHRALGQAEFFSDGTTLSVANLSASGRDGVRFDLDRAFRFGFDLSNLRISTAASEPEPETSIVFEGIGSIRGIPGSYVGSLRLTLRNESLAIVPDFSRLGSASNTVEIYRQGQLLARVTGLVGEIGQVPVWPSGAGLAALPSEPSPAIFLKWKEQIPITITGNSVVTGDELRVLPEAPNLQLDYLESFSLRTVGFESFAIAQEDKIPAARQKINTIAVNGSEVTLQFESSPDVDYAVEFRESFGARHPWLPLAAASGNGALQTLRRPVTSTSQGFYRVRAIGATPDLIVPLFETTGPAVVAPGGGIEVPVRAVVRNQGDASAGIFKTGVNYVVSLGTIAYVAAFTVPGQTDLWYPWSSGQLVPRAELTFTGRLTFHSSLRGQTVSMWAMADSCSGDEFMPEWCRVLESDENNNRVNRITLTLP